MAEASEPNWSESAIAVVIGCRWTRWQRTSSSTSSRGPVLEQEGKTIGVVTGAHGQRWFDLVVTGQEAHAGTTPMKTRRDALLGAARIVEAIHRIGPRAPAGLLCGRRPARRPPELAQHHPRGASASASTFGTGWRRGSRP